MNQNIKISREFLEYSHQNPELADFSFKTILEGMVCGQVGFEICAGFGNHCILKGDTIENSLLGFWTNNITSLGKPFMCWLPVEMLFIKSTKEDYLFGPIIEATQNIRIATYELN